MFSGAGAELACLQRRVGWQERGFDALREDAAGFRCCSLRGRFLLLTLCFPPQCANTARAGDSGFAKDGARLFLPWQAMGAGSTDAGFAAIAGIRNGLDVREVELPWFVVFLFGLCAGPYAEVGAAILFGDFPILLVLLFFVEGDVFGVPGLLARAEQGAVDVFIGLADGFDGSVGREALAVLGGYLQSVEEDLGATRVDAVRAEGLDHVGDGGEDSVLVFELRQVMDEGRRLAGFARRGFLVALVVVEVAEVLVGEGGRLAFLSTREDVATFDVHGWLSVRVPPGGGSG